MKKIIASYLSLLFLMTSQHCLADSIDARINAMVTPFAQGLSDVVFYKVTLLGASVPLIVVWLMIAATFFTVYFRFISLRGFKHAIDLVRGKYHDPQASGEVSHFKALTAALSATVGLGNIAGVAVAISIGGPGATIWMILAGFLGMSSKFAECTLGVKYRVVHADGSVSGGPMYYLEQGLAERNLPRLGKMLAILFSICCIGGAIGAGNLFQVNQAYKIVGSHFSEFSWVNQHAWIFGVVLASIVGFVIIGGIKSIANVTAKLVPTMALIYIISAMFILLVHAEQIPSAIALIVHDAFAPTAVAGGVLGAMINGFKRALFSSEAGIGSAAIAHATVKTKEPITEGLVSLLEPFIDTIVICTLTALLLVVTGAYQVDGLAGVTMTAAAFDSALDGFSTVLTLVVFLFAFSTLLTWSYYGTQAWMHLFGKSKFSRLSFQLLFCVFIVVGVTMELGSIVDFSDGMFFMMCLFNLIGLYILAPVIKKELNQYWQKLHSSS